MFAASTNPWLTFLGSFLATASHYDPIGAKKIADSAIHFYGRNPIYLNIRPIRPRFVVIYTDASHSIYTYRAHAGAWVQLQETDLPEERHNPVSWGSERLAKLYESVFSSEAKAVELGLKALFKVLPAIRSLFGQLPLILYTDNKALKDVINSTNETHPFATSSIDFIRQVAIENNISIRWVSTKENLADILTKPSRP